MWNTLHIMFGAIDFLLNKKYKNTDKLILEELFNINEIIKKKYSKIRMIY